MKLSLCSERASDIKFTALSYSWANLNPQFALDSTAAQSHFYVSELHKMFQDAILVTRKLGFRFLWIDYLCISPDEMNDRGWLHTPGIMNLMEMVYSHSTINLAATSTTESVHGLFSERNPVEVNPPVITLEKSNIKSRSYRVVDNSMWTREVDDAPLIQRGGFLQERLLPRRTVYFGRSQIFWECHSQDATEMLPRGLLPGRNIMKSSIKNLEPSHFIRSQHHIRSLPPENLRPLYVWTYMVKSCSQFRLGDSGDKLAMLSSFAAKYAVTAKSDYVAGMWQEGLIYQLLWQVAQRPASRRHQGVPSWSWASVDGPICQPHAWNPRALIAEVQTVNVLTADEEPFGTVFGGYLKIKGFVIGVNLGKPLDDYDSSMTRITVVQGRQLELSAQDEAEDEELGDDVQLDCRMTSLDQCFFLPIYFDETRQELRGLILIERLDRGAYERIGSCWVWNSTKISALLGATEYMGNRRKSILIV